MIINQKHQTQLLDFDVYTTLAFIIYLHYFLRLLTLDLHCIMINLCIITIFTKHFLFFFNNFYFVHVNKHYILFILRLVLA